MAGLLVLTGCAGVAIIDITTVNPAVDSIVVSVSIAFPLRMAILSCTARNRGGGLLFRQGFDPGLHDGESCGIAWGCRVVDKVYW